MNYGPLALHLLNSSELRPSGSRRIASRAPCFAPGNCRNSNSRECAERQSRIPECLSVGGAEESPRHTAKPASVTLPDANYLARKRSWKRHRTISRKGPAVRVLLRLLSADRGLRRSASQGPAISSGFLEASRASLVLSLRSVSFDG